MKRIISIILLSASLFAGNLEVDGGLSVTGEINANNQAIKNVGLPTSLTDAINGNVLQDALRDTAPYEVKFYAVKFWEIGTSNQPFNIQYRGVGEIGMNDGLENYLNLQLSSGWSINNVFVNGQGIDMTVVYELRSDI